MNAFTSLQNVISARNERAFEQAVAPLLDGKRCLLEHAACKVTMDETTLKLEASYTPAVQGVLDYYDREIDRVRQTYFCPRPQRSFPRFAPRRHAQV